MPRAAKVQPVPLGIPPRCRWCSESGEYLCDFALSAPGEPLKTCDAPMCREHRKCVARGMMDTRTKTGRRGGPGTGPFSIDHCPDHAPTE